MKTHQPCPLALGQSYIHSSGEVYPCAFLQGRYSLGNIKRQSLEEIWSGSKATEFRNLHLKGENPMCSSKQKEYNCHSLHGDNWPFFKKQPADLPLRLDIMMDSFCNLKCVMCTNRSEQNMGFEDENFWLELEKKILPQVHEIELVGGEPFILKNTFRLMDLVAKVNPQIRWLITTNGHFEFNEIIRNRLDRLHIHSLAVSIDSLVPQVFAAIRVGGSLDRLLRTLDRIIEYRQTRSVGKQFHLNCNYLIQKNNAFEIEQFINFCKDKNIRLYPNFVREPVEFSIYSLPENKLLQILDEYIDVAGRTKNLHLRNLVFKIAKKISADNLISRVDRLATLKDIIPQVSHV